MRQSHFADTNTAYGGRWVGPDGDFLVEVKRTNNARDVRGALLALAYALENEPVNAQAMLVLTESKLSTVRLREELKQFRHIVKEGIGRKIHLVAYSEDIDRMKGALPQSSDDLAVFIHDLVLHDMVTHGGRVSRVFVQSLVVDRWLQGRPMTSSLDVQGESKASKPTVIAALEHLRKLDVIAGPFGDFAVQLPSWDAWQSLALDLKSERKAVHFEDPSGLARRPSALLNRLLKVMNRDGRPHDVALSGVMAAFHFHEHLNITAAPRLDLSVYDGNTRFVRKLDAGLVKTENRRMHAPLVLHLGRRIRTSSASQTPGLNLASPLECLADLLDIGLMAEAYDFAQHLNKTIARGVTFS
ncbi:MAG: hypothetical protein R3E99_18465 [Burkholderiaceae bacterium]